METDLDLLSRYHRHGDAEAFQVLVAGHAGMVHATACRVTRDAALAQDVAQETFLALARSSGAAIQSVGAWLHHVALQKAQNVVRAEARRHNHEVAAANHNQPGADSSWAEIEPLLDETLAELPETTRALLIERYLEGRTQEELAVRLGVSQSTVSRQLSEAIHQLRQRFKVRGILGVASLASILSTPPLYAVPPALTASLSKISLTGIGTSSAIQAASFTTTLITMTATTKALLVTGTLAAVSLPFVIHRPEAKPIPASPPSVVKNSPAKPEAKPKGPQISDEEAFNLMFAGDLDKSRQAHALVEEYRAQHRGITLVEALKQDADIGAKTAEIMQMMAQNPKQFKVLWEATQFAMQMKGIKPSPQTQVKLQLDDAFMQTEAEAERFLGAVLSKDPDALAEVFSNVINSAAVEMALDPGADKTSTGVSINKDPLPLGTKIIQKEPED